MLRYSRCGEQLLERVETLLAMHHLLFIMEHTPPHLALLYCAIPSMRNTKTKSDGVTAQSGTGWGVSHVSVKHSMLQSLVSHWKVTYIVST